MKDKNLLASVALFGELYNSDKYTGISGVIAEFIKGAVALNKRYSLTSYEIKSLLKETYDFNIIESVIRYVLTTTLKPLVECRRNVFHFNDALLGDYSIIEREIEEKNNITDKIFSALIDYVTYKEKTTLVSTEINLLFENFTHFLFDNGVSEKYSNHISAFIVQNESNKGFIDDLNLIREGIILYQGLKYTGDIDELGIWRNELTIYLNTEYLFYALGYDGILFKEIFDDFFKLVIEINKTSQIRGGKNLIKLKYLPENQEEVESYFHSAESIKKGLSQLESWKTAMKTITDSCASPSDVASIKASFYLKLEGMGIECQEFDYPLNEYSPFIVEDLTVLEELRRISKEKSKRFDEETCIHFFNKFTKINFFRKGQNAKPFEKVKHVLMTESGFGKFLGHNNLVKFADTDTSFAKDITFITTRFWFTLKKGFADKNSLPKSFNVLTKAKIILASHINNSLSKAYDKLVIETKEGKISKEEALARSHTLRVKPNKPEDISITNIDSTFEFLNNEEYLDEVYREIIRKEDLLRETQIENERLQAEIDRRDGIEKQQKLDEAYNAFNKAKVEYVDKNLQVEKRKYIKALICLLLIFILNLSLATSAIIISISSYIKTWLAEFSIKQILVIFLFVLIVVIEALGSKYIFNRERISKGWDCFILIFSPQKREKLKASRSIYHSQIFEESNLNK